jgi:hypothetical protein
MDKVQNVVLSYRTASSCSTALSSVLYRLGSTAQYCVPLSLFAYYSNMQSSSEVRM